MPDPWDGREVTPEDWNDAMGCTGSCGESTWWVMDISKARPAQLGDASESDDDCPDTNSREQNWALWATARIFNQRNGPGRAPGTCPEGCECVPGKDEVVLEKETPVWVRWRRRITLEGHTHFCTYAFRYWLIMRKMRRTWECQPKEWSLPPVDLGPVDGELGPEWESGIPGSGDSGN